MRWWWLWVAMVVAAGIAAWGWPAPTVPPEGLYARADPRRVRALRAFRAGNPPRSLKVDGAVWEYASLGESKEALVFLHGMAGAYDIWWQQAEAFQSEFRVVSVTYPPVGTLGELERGVLAVLAREGVGRGTLVGTSLGGYLAQYLVARHPGRWRGVVLGNTFPPNDHIAARNRVTGALLPVLPEWLVLGQFRRNFRQVIHPTSDSDEFTLAFLNEVSYRMRRKDLVARYRCVIEKFTPVPPRAPTLILESDNDPLVEPVLREQLKAAYPAASVYTFRGGGHFPYLSRPAEYNRVLGEFLSRL